MKHPNRKKKLKHSTKLKYYNNEEVLSLFGSNTNSKPISCYINSRRESIKLKRYSYVDRLIIGLKYVKSKKFRTK